ncbi:MAG TPA: chemotaxis protein CheC [Clostridia bacterium]
MTMNFHSINIDVMKELGNIGAGNAATALAKMLNKKVNMDVPRVRILEFKDVNEILGPADSVVTGILLNVTGDINGSIMFILELNAARMLVDFLMMSPRSNNETFSDIELSALKEIGNILSGAYLSALSTITDLLIMPSIPDISIDMAGAILSVPAIEFGKIGDTVLYIETVFSEGEDRVVGDFFLIPDIDSYEILLKALGAGD